MEFKNKDFFSNAKKKVPDLPSNKKECIWDIAEYTVEPTQKNGVCHGNYDCTTGHTLLI